MKTDTSARIIEFVRSKQHARAHEIQEFIGFSASAIHRQLRSLVVRNILKKTGKPPLVLYTMVQTRADVPHIVLPSALQQIVDENFLFITPEGDFLYGIRGFSYWAKHYQSNKDYTRLAQEYADIIETKSARAPLGWLDITQKLTDTFAQSFVGHLCIADIYSYPVFGRTKLAKLVMYAKQSSSKKLVSDIARQVEPAIHSIIQSFQIDAVGFIPPTVPRTVQFMDIFEKNLSLNIPIINIQKVNPGEIPIPQKTLVTLADRVTNARGSIFPLSESQQFDRVLLIDDVVGSGASFQETARKLFAAGIGKKAIIAFAIVGNAKGYAVIRQM
jgi:hypothetical protein